jgi:F0F1-type ATP synthase gamma subunit
MEYAKKERRQQAFEDRQKKNRAKGKLKAIKIGKKIKNFFIDKPEDTANKVIGFMEQMTESFANQMVEKKPVSKKQGGLIAKGCGKVMSDKIKKTKMY